MTVSQLTDLQALILERLAGITPPWTLTEGGALAGFHLQHRTTLDLDLFWHGQTQLGPEQDEILRRLRATGLEVEVVQSSPGFRRLRVRRGDDVTVVDLVAEPVPCIEPPQTLQHAGQSILVDTRHEILTNKVCALLGRAEIRDLWDLQLLLEQGGDLDRALTDAARKDGGFSPLMLVWLLNSLDVPRLAAVMKLPPDRTSALLAFRAALVERVARVTGP